MCVRVWRQGGQSTGAGAAAEARTGNFHCVTRRAVSLLRCPSPCLSTVSPTVSPSPCPSSCAPRHVAHRLALCLSSGEASPLLAGWGRAGVGACIVDAALSLRRSGAAAADEPRAAALAAQYTALLLLLLRVWEAECGADTAEVQRRDKVANRDGRGSGGRSLTEPLRDARRFPSTRWYLVLTRTRMALGFGICPSFKGQISLSRRA